MKDVRELAATSDALEGCARSARCAAFATAAACIAATQDKEALFANSLKMPSKSADPKGLLETSWSCSLRIDASAQCLSCLAVMCQPNVSHAILPPYGKVTCRSMGKAAGCGEDTQPGCRRPHPPHATYLAFLERSPGQLGGQNHWE